MPTRWYSLIQKLDYKAKLQSKHLVNVDHWFTSSKTCAGCDHKVGKMRLKVRSWDCPSCGTQSIDQDINAAINIRQQYVLQLNAAGLSASAHRGLSKTGHTPAAA